MQYEANAHADFTRLKALFRRAARGEELTILPDENAEDRTPFYLLALILA